MKFNLLVLAFCSEHQFPGRFTSLAAVDHVTPYLPVPAAGWARLAWGRQPQSTDSPQQM